MRRALIVAFGCVAVLLLLVWLRGGAHIVTDEAKYVLNIAYPHPPGLRWLMHWRVGSLVFHIWFWRFCMISGWLAAFAYWMRHQRFGCPLEWCLLVLWTTGAWWMFAGNLLLVSATSAQALVLLAWNQRRNPPDPRLVSLWWMWMLFTSLQGLLFLPLVIAVLRRSVTCWRLGMYALWPLACVTLYVLSQPLALAILLHVTDAPSSRWSDAVTAMAWQWWLGAGLWLPVAIYGLLRQRLWWHVTTFGLLSFLAVREQSAYHAVLFLPLIVTGTAAAWPAVGQWRYARLPFVLIAAATSCFVLWRTGSLQPMVSQSRPVLTQVGPWLVTQGPLAIVGDFGHDWQYWSPRPVQRLVNVALQQPAAIVCLQACPELPGYAPMLAEGVQVFVRQP